MTTINKIAFTVLTIVILGLIGYSVWQEIDKRKLQNQLNQIDTEHLKELSDQERFWRKQIVNFTDSLKIKDGELDVSRGKLAQLKRKLKDIENEPIKNVASMDSTELLLELKRIRAAYRLH